MPFGTHDDKGIKRKTPLSEELLSHRYKNLVLLDNATTSDPLEKLIQKGKFTPALKQLSGDKRWAARIRFHEGKPVIHFMNTALIAVPHPTLKDTRGISVLKDLKSKITDNNLTYEIDTKRIALSQFCMMSPELGEEVRKVSISEVKHGISTLNVNLEGIITYAVVQKA